MADCEAQMSVPDRTVELAQWMRDALTEHELALLSASFPSEAPIYDQLRPTVSHAERCFEAVRLLERHGAVDGEFFARLRALRPRRADEIDHLAASFSDRATDLEPALAEYRAWLAQSLRWVRLPAPPPPDRLEQTAIELLDLFEPQQVQFDVPRHDHSSRRKPDERPAESPRRRSLDALLLDEASPWLLLLGGQGVGKSMATRWLALRLCVDGRYPAALPPGLLPVHVELRRFARRRRELGEGYTLFDHLATGAPKTRHPLRAADFQRLAEAGRLVWLFDGIDEITDPDLRSDVLDILLSVRHNPGRGILTCRLVGSNIIRDRVARHDIACVTLLDFDDDQVHRFLTRWHELAFPRERERGAKRCERLRNAIDTNVTLHDLSRNPFLLSLIVLHIDAPPRGRRDLLERATERLLAEWDADPGISGPARFTYTIKRKFLEKLAWWMMTSHDGAGNVISADHLHSFTRKFCEDHFPHERNIADGLARTLHEHLRDRACIFGYAGDDTYEFLHRAFLGFFAASELYGRFCSDPRAETLEAIFAAHWYEWQWRQTLALTCAFLCDRPDVVVRLLHAAIDSIGPRFPFTAMDMLAELCILGLVETDLDAPGPARECALAINDWLYHSPDWHGIRSALTQLFGSVSGRWPGLLDLLDRAPPGRRDERFLLPFLAGLPDRQFLDLTLARIEARALQPFVVHGAQAMGRWRSAFTPELTRRALAAAPTTTLVFALALAHEAFLPWTMELRRAVLDAAPEAYHAELHGYLMEVDEDPRTFASLARMLRLLLTLALCDAWPDLVFSHDFAIDLFATGSLAPTAVAVVRCAFSAVAATQRGTAGLSHEIVQSQSLPFLDDLLAYYESHPSLLRYLPGAFVHHPWQEGLAHAIGWAGRHPEFRAFSLDAEALLCLQFPADEALTARTERSLDVYASATPPEFPAASWFWAVHTFLFHLDDPSQRTARDLVQRSGLSRFPDKDLELRLAIAALLPGARSELLALIREAAPRRPLLAASYWKSTGEAQKVPPLPSIDALLSDVHGPEDERRLLELAGLVQWVSFWERTTLPWLEMYRYLVDHGSSAAVRIEAAVELAERDALERLRGEFPESQELIEALAFLDARSRLLQVGGRERRA
ncbi:MAG: NACHT domain-containing protein [Myxococcales bacterium]|nr:NACHT domain-containing protein [Myxococcales bacterium]